MKTEFPLLDQIVTQRGRVDLLNAKLFNVQNIHDIEQANGFGKSLQFLRDFNPHRLPFPHLWMEYKVDNHWEGFEINDVPMGRLDELLRKVRVISFQDVTALPGDQPEANLTLIQSYESSGITPQKMTLLILIESTLSGDITNYWFANPHSETKRVDNLSPEEMNFEISGVFTLAAAALLAVKFMNCKNVDTETRTTRPRGGKKTRRSKPGIEYRIIKLPGSQGGANNANGTAATKLHSVRGHFKTYTAEAPLMGKNIGTYWFEHHARGSKAHGEIISSYQQ